MLCTNMSYETNDDYSIANRIMVSSPYVEFTDYFLCSFLAMIQKWLPMINVFVAFQVAMSFFAFVTITKLSLDLDRSVLLRILCILILAVYSFDHYAVIQFTKTSGLLAAAGMLLIVDTIVHRRNRICFLWALIFMFASTMLRFEMCVFPICFAGLYLLMRILHGRHRIREGGYLAPHRMVGYVLMLMLLGSAAGVHFLSDAENLKTQELRDYIYYSTYRSYVVDYPIYEHFKEHPEEYSDIDITKNDFSLIDHWYFDYDGAASAENLTKIKQAYDRSETAAKTSIRGAASDCLRACLKSMKEMDSGGIQIWILLGIAAVGILRLRPAYWWYIVAAGLGAAAFYLLLYEMGRPAYRVIYIVNLSATLFLLHACDRQHFWRGPDRQKNRILFYAGKVLAVCGCAVLAAGLAWGIWQSWDMAQSHAAKIERNLRPAQLAERIAGDTEHMYVFATSEKCNTKSYAHPLMPPDPDVNAVSFGGWGTLSPYLMDRLKAYDLNNVFSDVIDNESVYVIEDKRVDQMEEYFNRWYGDPQDPSRRISYKPAGEVDGYQIWQVVTGQ
ncbi:MAG: hypothetical protein IJ109_01410 [Firmicutes bacterium]|nr:hypothetical protein [Bacillota bacterium]